MGSKSAIEWTDASWNPTYGCTKVSPACRNCYIVTTPPYRIRGKRFDAHGRIPIEMMPERLDLPLTWHEPKRIFVDSLSDLFHEDVGTSFIAAVYASMALASWHTFQMLTKRPDRRRELLSSPSFREEVCAIANTRRLSLGTDKGYAGHGLEPMTWDRWPLPNVWEGVTVENQRYADERIPILLDTPSAVRFLSCEPLLGPIMLGAAGPTWLYKRERAHDTASIDWVIAGGESGSLEWIRSLRDQCNAAGVAFVLKQWGGRTSKSAGRLLDGREWTQYPDGKGGVIDES